MAGLKSPMPTGITLLDHVLGGGLLHETTIRELRITSNGLVVGDALVGFRGVLTGVPVLTGPQRPLDGDGV